MVNVLIQLLEHLSFRLRCPSFLLSKFASQLKLIQSMVRVGIRGICVTSSILRVLHSGFWVEGSQVPSPSDPVLRSWVSRSHVPGSQFQGPGCQGPVFQGPRVPGSRVSESRVFRVPSLRVSGSRAQVLILDYTLNLLYYEH